MIGTAAGATSTLTSVAKGLVPRQLQAKSNLTVSVQVEKQVTRKAVGIETQEIKQSLATGKEHSISHHPKKGVTKRIGEVDAVSVDQGSINTFHTHPSGTALFSPDDIKIFIDEGNFPKSAVHRVGGEKWPNARSVDPGVPLEPIVTEVKQVDLLKQFKLEGGELIDRRTGIKAQTTIVDKVNLTTFSSVEETLKAWFKF